MSKEIPPPLELECLKVLWRLEQGNVKQVQDALLEERREIAYTTVMTLLDRLNKRGAVQRIKNGRQFVYTPAVARESLRQKAVEALVENFFDGQIGGLRDYLARSAEPAVQEPVRASEPLDSVLL